MLKIEHLTRLFFYNFDIIEERFLRYIEEIVETRPFWWYHFINRIIANTQVTYIKDSTMIISIYDLSNNSVNIVYEIIKRLLQLKAAVRVIKKKEFLIVHLHSVKIVEYLKSKEKWLGVLFCKTIKECCPHYDCYLDATWLNEHEEFLIDVCIQTENKIVFLNVEKPLLASFNNDKIKKMFLTLSDKSSFYLSPDYEIIKFRYNKPEFLKNLKSSFQLLAIPSEI